MQEQHLYEYAVIRVVPKVEREEFLNVGLILFCKKAKYLRASCLVDERRISLFSHTTDCEQIRHNLHAIENITAGKREGGPIAMLDKPERFRWLTAVRSSVIQTSRPHPGLTDDLDATFNRLLINLVRADNDESDNSQPI